MELDRLIPWRREKDLAPRPADPFQALHQRITRLFEELDPLAFRPPESFGLLGGGAQPRLDLAETDEELRISAELPGVGEDDVEVTLHDDHLVLRGEKRAEAEYEEGGRRYTERAYGSFSRTIPLPCEIKSDQAEARFEKGVLTIRLPKAETAARSGRKLVIQKG